MHDLFMELKPRYVFFPHWSHIIPQDIYENFECVIFHMTDFPFGSNVIELRVFHKFSIYQQTVAEWP